MENNAPAAAVVVTLPLVLSSFNVHKQTKPVTANVLALMATCDDSLTTFLLE